MWRFYANIIIINLLLLLLLYKLLYHIFYVIRMIVKIDKGHYFINLLVLKEDKKSRELGQKVIFNQMV